MDQQEIPDPLSGQVVVGRLTLSRVVFEAAEQVARQRGTTVLQLVRLGFAEWLRTQGVL